MYELVSFFPSNETSAEARNYQKLVELKLPLCHLRQGSRPRISVCEFRLSRTMASGFGSDHF